MLGQVSEKTIKQNGNDQTTDDRVSRPDSDGKLSEYSRTVGQETKNATGETTSTVETYSTYVPGAAQDGQLHLNQRITTTQNKASDQTTTEQGPNPGNRSDGLQVTAKTKYTVQYAASGAQQTKTVQAPGANGTFQAVLVRDVNQLKVPPVNTPSISRYAQELALSRIPQPQPQRISPSSNAEQSCLRAVSYVSMPLQDRRRIGSGDPRGLQSH